MPPIIFIPGREDRLFRYAAAVRRAGGVPRFSLDASDAGGCAGLLLPGGGDLDPALYGQPCRGSCPPDPAQDLLEQVLLDRFVSLGAPVLGICRGCQAVNVFFGGTLFQDIGGHGQTEGRDRLHPAAAAEASLSRRLLGASFLVNSAHHQAVDRPGDGLWVDLRAEDGVIEGLYHPALPVWGLQWHPERLPAGPGMADAAKVFDWLIAQCRTAPPAST